MKYRLQIAALLLFVAAATSAQVDKRIDKVSYLEAGSIIDFRPIKRHLGFFESDLRTYCYSGEEKSQRRYFESVELHLEIDTDDYTQYEGGSPSEVREHYDEQRSLFSFSLFSQKRSRLQLSPFTQKCIGIETMQAYRVRLQVLRLDFWRLLQLIAGVFLFIYAGHLSHNAVFYYITGVTLGICSSFMLVIWLSSKLVPRRPMMYGVLIGGWTVGIYVIQLLWENLQVIVLTYRTYVFWYILITGLVSFFFCYRLGPPKNKRSKNIIKWLLQLMALVLIYFSSHYEEAAVSIMIITIVLHYFPRSVFYKMRAMYLRHFPPKRRLLTSEEYYEEGVRETTKALEELRSYASSPNCKQWKVISKLRDPMRFAAFVEGASHLRDDEILNSESFKQDNEMNDSSEDGEEILEQHPSASKTYIHRSLHQMSYRRPSISTHEEMSEDEEDADAGRELVGSSNDYSMRHTPTLNHSRRFTTNSSSSFTSSPIYHEASLKNRSSVRRIPTPTRSARMVTAAKNNNSYMNIRHGDSVPRNFEKQEYNGESDY